MKETRFMQVKRTFSLVCQVEVNIQAKPEIVWALLTDANNFARWNSTVTGIDGVIREGERIRIHVPGTKRTFTPRVTDVVQNERMIWSDGVPMIFKGTRSFVLKPNDNGSTLFIMKEHFHGLVFALVKGMLPDFKGIFEAYANDLRLEAERLDTDGSQQDHAVGSMPTNYHQQEATRS
ncbi:MAG TPA: SRPBCC domain-containing protein [Cyclobacteriaceae bacterium]|jgi:uncharacterized protein YndB with AHSA1/START domain|nr:SRPBCC domain-containing protein [Cyclobacteriaceae bacterium]